MLSLLSASDPLTVGSNGRRLVARFLPVSGDRAACQVLLEEIVGHDVCSAFGLTSREAEVLVCVRDGGTNGEVAETLHIAPTTVRRHLENIFRKLDVTTRTAAVARAFPPQAL